MKKYLFSFALSAIVLAGCGKKEEAPAAAAPASAPVAAAPVNAEEKVLNIYNWPDYVPKDMIANFEKESGIKVNYDTFETNEALQAKLVAGSAVNPINSMWHWVYRNAVGLLVRVEQVVASRNPVFDGVNEPSVDGEIKAAEKKAEQEKKVAVRVRRGCARFRVSNLNPYHRQMRRFAASGRHMWKPSLPLAG